MNFYKKLVVFATVCFFILNVVECNCYASFLEEMKSLREIEIDTNFSVVISDTYTNNKCIVQATANENGDFCTMSYYVFDRQENYNSDNVFLKKFLDVFNNKGEFICELSFITELDPSIKMLDNKVYIIFYGSVLIFDFIDLDIKYYSYNISSIEEVYEELFYKKNKFEVGEWKYKLAKQQSIGYRQLIRYNETEKQVLVDIPLEIDNGLIIMLIVISFIVTIEVVKLIRKRKAKINYQE